MIQSALRYIRRQPKSVRNQYALAIASTFTGIVALVWLVGTVADPFKSTTSPDSSVATETERSAPFSGLIKQLKDQWAAVQGAVSTSTAETPTEAEVASTSANALGSIVLTPETIADAAMVGATSTSVVAASSSTAVPMGYREIRIATTTIGREAVVPGATTTTTTTGDQ